MLRWQERDPRRAVRAGSDMTDYQLYCFAQSGNSYKVALMLNLIGARWSPIFVDFFNGETRSDRYRSEINELGEAPVLVAGGRKLSQSGAILRHLSTRSGRFGGDDEAAAEEILRWILFDNHKFTSYLATFRFMHAFAKGASPQVLEFLKGRCGNALKIVAKHLERQPFVVGPHPTIADLSMCGYLFYPAEEFGFDVAAEYPPLAAWLARIRTLPGWAHPYVLMPGHPLAAADITRG
jgi:glutathione S-transferase